MDSSLDLVPGRLQAAHCSWGVLEEGQSRMGKRQKINSPRPQACVCVCVSVCVLCRFHVFTCVAVCRLCDSSLTIIQLYAYNVLMLPICSPTAAMSCLTACLGEIKACMSNNFLQLNSSKTEALLVGTPHQVQSSSLTHLTFDSQVIPLSSTVTNLGVRFDPHLTFNDHIKHLCKTSFYHLRTISKLRPTLWGEACPRLYLLKTGLL